MTIANFAHSSIGFGRRRQQGVVMILTLIALVLLLFSTMALVKSFDTSQTMAGNIGFKRDLANQAERGMAMAIGKFVSSGGPLVTKAARESNLLSSNYFATKLDSDSHGIPKVLIKDSDFTGTDADISDSGTNVKIRYVIDRLCHSTGAFDVNTCVSVNNWNTQGGTGFLEKWKVGDAAKPIYRISVRVNGPRNTQAYLQTTFAR
jgi:type IV pilus assembly protein PilX